MNSGFNPMRWNCRTSGCFNVKRRPKIEVFAECFPRRINFGDVDGIVELSGKFLMLEWKGDGGAIRTGQARTYVEFTRNIGNLVLVVHGDAETMTVEGYSQYWSGKPFPFVTGDLDAVKDRMRRWVHWAQTSRLAA